MQGDYQYDSAAPPEEKEGGHGTSGAERSAKKQVKAKKLAKEGVQHGEKLAAPEDIEPIPFSLRDLNLQIPHGSHTLIICVPAAHVIGALVCIVGRVGTGKTALFTAMINGMRTVKGDTIFGGHVGYGMCSLYDLSYSC
jgi:ATP-binding cassette subfamily C (CFTR/MRP) protein 1